MNINNHEEANGQSGEGGKLINWAQTMGQCTGDRRGQCGGEIRN